ncbi:unnamed protein product [Spirodela intermedia]|uniref:Uncharacterized protein n=1 Tax=Spirodela intermedia TaxID=51605 RepID=A0ABN7EDF9_SPIIN|nr:unnamed protein product [Spirodela intermedia]
MAGGSGAERAGVAVRRRAGAGGVDVGQRRERLAAGGLGGLESGPCGGRGRAWRRVWWRTP